jgi:hypothetical protein
MGGSVTFPNMDPIFHNVFSLSKPKAFDLGNFPKGDTRTVTFPKRDKSYALPHPGISLLLRSFRAVAGGKFLDDSESRAIYRTRWTPKSLLENNKVVAQMRAKTDLQNSQLPGDRPRADSAAAPLAGVLRADGVVKLASVT